MNLYEQTFTQIDSAWIVFTELAAAIACVLWFIENRKTSPFPGPQLMLAMGFVLAVNLFGRAFHKEWFSFWDKALYTGLAIIIWRGVVTSRHRNKVALETAETEARLTGKPIKIAPPDFFDKISNQVVWGMGIAAFVWTLVYVDKLQTEYRHKDAALLIAADTARAHAEEKSAAVYGGLANQVDSLSSQVAIVQGQNDTIMDKQDQNVAKVLKGQEKSRQNSDRNTKKMQRTLQSTVIDTRPAAPKRPEKESPNFWERVRKQFGLSVRNDTVSYVLPPYMFVPDSTQYDLYPNR